MDSQLKKGLLDLCVLAQLRQGDGYGYQILKDLSGVITVSESTLYPILRRLEKQNYLNTYTRECDGRLRKYYHITEDGRGKLLRFNEEYREIAAAFEFINRRETP